MYKNTITPSILKQMKYEHLTFTTILPSLVKIFELLGHVIPSLSYNTFIKQYSHSYTNIRIHLKRKHCIIIYI